MTDRRRFIKKLVLSSSGVALGSLLGGGCQKLKVKSDGGKIITVLGAIEPEAFGPVLPHEHIMVDFIGADKTGKHRYDPDEVYETMLPYLEDIRKQGVTGFVECTPMFLGRDPEIFARLARASGMHIMTCTGLYKEPYLPASAFDQTPDELAKMWSDEIKNGIEGTGIRAGFIKIAVLREDLKPVQQKIVRAACRTHNATGATIACHDGHGPASMQILDILEEEGTPADALIVVHANSEKDLSYHYKMAERGAWVEYDNVGRWPAEMHIELISDMIERGFGGQLLLSMDRGWYRVGEPDGGEVKPFTHFFNEFIPEMRKAGFDDEAIQTLTVTNPARAFQLDIL